MADETTRVDQWITSVLTGDATITSLVGARIYADIAPPESTYPLILTQMQSADDVLGAGYDRIMIDGLWLIRAVLNEPSYVNAKPIADRIDALFHAKPGPATSTVASVDGATILCSMRERPFRLAEESGGRQYRHLGAMYRINAQL